MKNIFCFMLAALLLFSCTACTTEVLDTLSTLTSSQPESPAATATATEFHLADVPAYTGEPYAVVNNDIPFFTADEIVTESYEIYSPLDALGRCGVCTACVGQDIMPTEKRGNIGSVKPTGWQITRYDGVVEGNYLYNRCHLLAYMLTAENANKCNLITGTRYLNQTMIPFENKVCNYVQNTGHHVMYRVTPVFEGENLLASGVLMEARSVEDGGESVQFCIYCYNVQPKIVLDYATGESRLAETENTVSNEKKQTYILNTKSKRFHTTDCSSADDISEENRKKYTGYRQELIDDGYTPCQKCKP